MPHSSRERARAAHARRVPPALALAALTAVALPPALAADRAADAPARASAQPDAKLEEIVVSASFRDAAALDLPTSVTVLDSRMLRDSTLQHFEEATAFVPNLNWSGEGSRARYFQLRGIGELEQYEGAPNPSVGFVIDDIDFSSLGSAATLFDVDRVEVLRGPQGTRYGANALGGLIYMRSTEPPDQLTANFELTSGSDDTAALGAAVGGPISDNAAYRVSVQDYRSNGFRRNTYLHRDDTYGRDESTTRAKLRWDPSERLRVEATGLYVDLDNGYDAWTIDNDFTTESDRPGRDAQRSVAGSVRLTASLDGVDVVSISSANRTNAVYSFDEDWGNPDLWAPYIYDYFSKNNRLRRTVNEEVRVLSKPGAIADGRGDWLAGVYLLDLAESNDRVDTGVLGDSRLAVPVAASDVLDTRSQSDYDARNLAAFGEVRFTLGDKTELTAGLRSERRTAHYADTNGNRFAPVDRMMGGELALTWRVADTWRTYARLARGYKAGGFNTSFAGVDFSTVDNVNPEEIEYGPESLWSLEAGIKGDWLDGRLDGEVGLFAARRDDQQIKIPLQLRRGDPSTFLFLTENAEESKHSGLEASLAWRPTQRVEITGALGLLSTEITEFSLYPALEGREQAHAPRSDYALGAEYRAPQGWWGRVDLEGRGSFYFDYGHDQKSKSYSIVNLRLGRDFGPWSATLWARNLFDKRYAVRGFFFGNEPPDFEDKLYVRLGDPRHVGVTINYRL
ncbi:MAG TPA: TonB-dependent receptor [Gammaproteobacteria bacterium]|nr:TonB-dependent receptor [Gammaproteobacteria bacterium]